MRTFKFGQLVTREDICDRNDEVKLLNKICQTNGRAIVYGPRRYGKTSVVRNIVMEDFLSKNKKSFAIFVDLFKLQSETDFIRRLKTAIEESLAKRAKIKNFLNFLKTYLKNVRLDFTFDAQTGIPQVSLKGEYLDEKKSLAELFTIIRSLSKSTPTLLILDEFQDVVKVEGLEAALREQIQKLSNMPVIFLGSRQHLLKDLFQNESRPFYGVGVDVEFKPIARQEWLPYMKERFKLNKKDINKETANTLCELMADVPNSIQELCHWIWLSDNKGLISTSDLYHHLESLIANKASRFSETLAPLTEKEIKTLLGIAKKQPIQSIQSATFLSFIQMSAGGVKAAAQRLAEDGKITETSLGYQLTDPLLRLFIIKKYDK